MYYSAVNDRIYKDHQELKDDGLTIVNVITVITRQPDNFDASYHELDAKNGNYDKDSHIFTFAMKLRTSYIIFDKKGEFIQEGYSLDALQLPKHYAEFVEEGYRLVRGNVIPRSEARLDHQIFNAIMFHFEDLRGQFMALTNSGEKQREFWSGKEFSAKEFKAGMISDADKSIIQQECDDRKKDETVEQLVDKQLAKGQFYRGSGNKLEGLQRAAIDKVKATQGAQEKTEKWLQLKIEANAVFDAIKKKMGG